MTRLITAVFLLSFGFWGVWHCTEFFQRHALETFRPRSKKLNPLWLYGRFLFHVAVGAVSVILVGFAFIEAAGWFLDLLNRPPA